MRKKAKISMVAGESADEAFSRFLLTKHAGGVITKTIDTCSRHFHAISKHLDIHQEITDGMDFRRLAGNDCFHAEKPPLPQFHQKLFDYAESVFVVVQHRGLNKSEHGKIQGRRNHID